MQEAKNYAVKYMIAHAFMTMYFHFDMDSHQVRDIHNFHIKKLREKTFPKLPPVMSDVFADEVLGYVKDIIRLIEEFDDTAEGTIGCNF